MTVPVVLAATAAFLFAAGSNLQRHAAARVPHAGIGPVRLVRRLLRSRRWLAGGGCAVVGLGLQVRALPAGGVITVQSVIASTLVFSLLIEAVAERRRPSTRQVGGSLLVVAGLVVLIRIGRPALGESLTSLWLLALLWAVVAVVGGGALLHARHRPRGRRTAMLLGAAAGACFAVDAVFLRDITEAFSQRDALRVVVDVAGFALTSVVGNLTMQRGFHLAPLRHVLPSMAASEPITAFFCGWLLFGERFHAGWAASAAVGVGLLCVVVGVLVCSLSPSARPADSPACPVASSAQT
jgi:drug/metabolite transporter (DMT)-like permease